MARTTGSTGRITGPKVRQAALRLIAEHGYAAVSMRRIAAEVGVQAGALYNYTPDKQSLLFELMQAHMDALLDEFAALEMPDDPAGQLEAFTRFHIRFHLPRADAVFVAYMELRNLDPGNFARIEALRRAYEDALEAILRDGCAAGAFRLEDTRIAALGLIALLTGVTNWYRSGGRLPAERIEDLYWDMVRGAVGG